MRAAHDPEGFLRDGRPQVAFVGRSNVGKSSLLNRLLGRKQLARTSSKPGRTQAVHYYLIHDRLWFVDLPGFGYAKVSKEQRRQWASLTEAYFRQALPGAVVVLLIDGKVGGTSLDATAWEYLNSLGADTVVVATKIDKVPRTKRSAAIKALRERVGIPAEEPVVPFSATTGEGVGELWRRLTTHLESSEEQ